MSKLIGNVGTVDGAYTCVCCGAKPYTPETFPKGRTKYIAIAAGEVKDPIINSKWDVNVVQTKNGPVTIGVRHEW